MAEQVYMYMDFTQDALYGTYKDLYGINIVTDVRHGWRKNAKDSSVVAHKVIDCVHVTKAQDPVNYILESKTRDRV